MTLRHIKKSVLVIVNIKVMYIKSYKNNKLELTCDRRYAIAALVTNKTYADCIFEIRFANIRYYVSDDNLLIYNGWY